jgi:hypothetical protein
VRGARGRGRAGTGRGGARRGSTCRLFLGDGFLASTPAAATEYVERKKREATDRLDAARAELVAIREQKAKLRTALNARLGGSIGLDTAEDDAEDE